MFDILGLKQSFFLKNNELLEKNNTVGKFYTERPKRLFCKLCNAELPSDIYFTSHGLNYYLCSCGHLNGEYSDDKFFSDALYLSSHYGDTFYKEIGLQEFTARVDSIYIPKASFLINTFKALNIQYKVYKYLDIGAGSGYMVSALKRNGLQVKGIDVSASQVQYGNEMIGEVLLEVVNPANITKEIASTDCEVISFIGVLEHIENLRDVLNAIKDNTHIKYIFFIVPMLSFSCIVEACFPQVFNRLLSGGHTHLFSKESLEWMYSHYGFTVIANWNFGTDIMDLYRSFIVTLEQNGAHKEWLERIHFFFREHADILQMSIDKASFCSETHVLAQVNHG